MPGCSAAEAGSILDSSKNLALKIPASLSITVNDTYMLTMIVHDYARFVGLITMFDQLVEHSRSLDV